MPVFLTNVSQNKFDHKGRLHFWCGRRECNSQYFVSGPFHFALLRPEPTLLRNFIGFDSTPYLPDKNKFDHKGRLHFWCGRRESNPRLKLGKLSCYHYTTPAGVYLHCIIFFISKSSPFND